MLTAVKKQPNAGTTAIRKWATPYHADCVEVISYRCNKSGDANANANAEAEPKTVASSDVDEASAPADAADASAQLIVIGNYELNEETRTKLGALLFYTYDYNTSSDAVGNSVENENENPAAAQDVLTAAVASPLRPLFTQQTCGILDCKFWKPQINVVADNQVWCCSAREDGAIGITILSHLDSPSSDSTSWHLGGTSLFFPSSNTTYTYEPPYTSINSIQTAKNFQKILGKSESSHANPLLLSIDVSRHSTEIVVSDAVGGVSYCCLFPSGELVCEHQYKEHTAEVWNASFIESTGKNQKPIEFYSGADDALLIHYDIRMQSANVVTRKHNAGVCSITGLPEASTISRKENTLLTGSYDEYLRIWDNRNWRQPLKELNLGGGVWRLRCSLPDDIQQQNSSIDLLTSCMHNGFHVLKINFDNDVDVDIQQIGSFYDHDSLAYGADWIRANRSQKGACTCSFYDNTVHIWSLST